MRMHGIAALVAAGVMAATAVAPTVAAQSACADLRGTVDADGICQVHTATKAYTLNFNFPDDYPDQRSVVEFLTQSRDGFVNVAEDPDAFNLPYELDANGTAYRSGRPDAGTRSLVFTVWQNVGGPHPQTFYQAFNWDVAEGAPITFDTLFKAGSKPLEVIYPEVNRDLRERQGMLYGISESEGLDPSNYQNFALTDDAVLFFFSQGEVMEESAGPLQASVPRAKLAPLLAI